jgi:hypothetical protein
LANCGDKKKWTSMDIIFYDVKENHFAWVILIGELPD